MTPTSALLLAVVATGAVALLFSSLTSKSDVLTVATLLKDVSGGVSAGILATMVKILPSVVTGRLGLVHSTVPLSPTLGVEQVHPAGELRETNVIPIGNASLIVALFAAAVPPLSTV